jgi:protein-S-isoprenylcysteine O-methyltransferase Ste14
VCPALIYIFTGWLDFGSVKLGESIRLSAAVLMLLNIGFFFWIHYTLGKNWSPILEILKNQSLIMTGPYGRIRHPMYASIFIHAFLLFPVTANWFVGSLAILSFGLVYPFRVQAEEQMLIEQFGERYKEYMKRTGRLFPKWN